MGSEGFPRELKRLGHEADHSAPSGMEVTNEWSCTTTSPRALMVCKATLPLPLVGTRIPVRVFLLEKVINYALENIKKQNHYYCYYYCNQA
jgi:hypothetical protein